MAAALIQCVVVLYGQGPIQAPALSSLLQICADDALIESRLEILVQDNSLKACLPEGLAAPKPFEYFHAPSNPGLADAYNRALARAQAKGLPWLLTLDQDTVLARHFFLELIDALESGKSGEVCAYVPELVKKGLVLSPQMVGRIFYYRLPPGFSGFAKRPVMAFNSAACLSVAALVAIGGYPREYWLDYLDHIVFYRLQAAGGRVFILNTQLEHSLSLQDIESEVSIQRYTNVLAAEWRFVRDSGSSAGSIIHRIRLLKRALIHTLKLRNKSYAVETLKAVLQ